MDYRFLVNGFEVDARYDESAVKDIFLPLIHRLDRLRRENKRRVIAFLAAPPAVGKSTLAAFLEHLAREEGISLQSLGMDGFHHHQDYILSHTVVRDGKEIPMKAVKGAPESFDVEKLKTTLARARNEDILWPFYDRRLHDVVEDAVPVTGDTLLIEGNWLLLDEPVWRDMPHDLSVFIEGAEEQLKERLILRKMRGGLSREEAEAFYLGCDGPNIRRCMACRLSANLTLSLLGDGEYLIL